METGDGRVDMEADPLAEMYHALEMENRLCCDLFNSFGYKGDLLHKTIKRQNMENVWRCTTQPNTKEVLEALAKVKTHGQRFLVTGRCPLMSNDAL